MTIFIGRASPGVLQLEPLGPVVRVSEPPSSFHLVAGAWPANYRDISQTLSTNPGVYVCITSPDAKGLRLAYVGYAGMSVRSRLRTQAFPRRNPIEWFCAFAPHWSAITKTHASLLEAKLYRFFECSDAVLLHGDSPALFDLGPLDQQVVDEAYRSFLYLLPFAGLPHALSPLIDEARRELGYGSAADTVGGEERQVFTTYAFRPGPGTAFAGLKAYGSDIERGFLIHPGSEYRLAVSHDIGAANMDRRSKLEASDFLAPVPDRADLMVFVRPKVFTSAMTAARVIAGYAVWDRRVWVKLPHSPLTMY
jgi:hypothetical protein